MNSGQSPQVRSISPPTEVRMMDAFIESKLWLKKNDSWVKNLRCGSFNSNICCDYNLLNAQNEQQEKNNYADMPANCQGKYENKNYAYTSEIHQ